ncbi:MAG: polysaccharide biosynthesis tyrosine autokinase [Chloroflexi bacterium]|nr:polysaccharide biosynthesis tyrosine autokinase [Chloroflexota bacterium]
MLELITYFRIILWRQKWVIGLTVVGAAVAAVVLTQFITPVYTASAELRASPNRDGALEYAELLYVEQLMNTYIEIATSSQIKRQAEEVMGLDEVPDYSLNVVPGTDIIRVDATSEDPALAAATANTVAQLLEDEGRTLLEDRSRAIAFIAPATVPEEPSSPNLIINVAIALIAGGLGGLGLAFWLEKPDTKVYASRDVADMTDLPIMGRVPTIRGRKKQQTLLNGNSIHAEAFRHVRTNILSSVEGTNNTVLFVSAEPGDGKSTTVANVAFAMGQAQRRALVIDADMRRPTLHRVLDLPNEVGLSSVLTREKTLREAMQETHIPGLYALTSGPNPGNPAELVNSELMTRLLEKVREHFDIVLVDSPAAQVVTDASVLASQVDGVVMIVGLAQTRGRAIIDTLRQMRQVKAQVLGVVVSHADVDFDYKQYKGYYTS